MNDINEIDIEAFARDYHDAKMYHYRARQFIEEEQCFSVVFNVASVALERYLVALCGLYGIEPENHNYTCLMDALETIITVPVVLNQEIRSLDSIFGICSLENYHHGAPESTDSERVLTLCNEVYGLFDQTKVTKALAAKQRKGE